MTYRTIGLEIDDDIYQSAVSRAVAEGKTINQVLVELLRTFAAERRLTDIPSTPLRPVGSTPQLESSSPLVAVVPTTTPAPVVTTPSAQPAIQQSTYIVQSGDTLGAIAKKIYGTATKYFLIQKANNITDPRRIWVGQTLVIPTATGEVIPGAVVTTPAAPVSTPVATPVSPTPVAPVTVVVNPPENIRFVGSPNFNRRPQGEISAIVVHATANGTLERVVDWFNNPAAQVSAHYTIGKDGTTVQHVSDEHRAWHAGTSEWQGRSDLNSWSIGIELVNWNNGADPFPEAQHLALVNLAGYLCKKYGIKPELILAHYDVAPRRKTDPKGYDMDRLRREVAAQL